MDNIDNRFTYHSPSGDQPERYAGIRASARDFAHLIDDYCPEGPEKVTALNKLDETVMWANAGIARSAAASALPECATLSPGDLKVYVASVTDLNSVRVEADCPEHPSKKLSLVVPVNSVGSVARADLCRAAGCPKMRGVGR